MAQSRFRVPHTLALLFGMIVLALILTYALPAGTYEREQRDGREAVVPGSYGEIADAQPLSPLTLFTAIPRGFADAQDIIFFVFIIGGAFGVFRATGAADALIGFLLEKMGSVPALLVGGGMFVFAAGSSSIGMAEEYLPFVPMLLALAIGLGFDAVVAVGILCMGYAVGYGAALINPFTVIIAQDIAGLTPGSGKPYRLLLTFVFLAIAFDHVWRYARRVKADPSRSLVADVPPDPKLTRKTHEKLTGPHILAISAVVLTLAVMVVGIDLEHWYLIEMGALFTGLAILLGLIGRLGVNKTAIEFCNGAAELTTTALLIGFARTIQVVLADGQVVDTIIHGVAQPLKSLGPHAAAVGMFAFQSLLNFFIPSGSGQAYVTMPLMAPLADVVGVTRQTSVLAYQFGDGFTNILVPTNAVLVGILAMARIPYERWLRFVLPFMIKVWIAGSIALVIAVAFGY
jgi:uncharacterized ion transporter superfamily protein YfcC